MATEDDEKEGGFNLGSISFGVGPSPAGKDAGSVTGEAPRGPKGVMEHKDTLLPLRVLLVTELVPRKEVNAGASAPEHALRVSPAELDELLKKLKPRLAFEVESVLLDGKRTKVELAPTAMKSFRPDALCTSIPLLRSLLDGKKVLERLRDGTVSVEAAGSELGRLWNHSSFVARVLGGVEIRQPKGAAAPISDRASSEEDVDAILSMVDTGTRADDASPAGGAPAPAPASPSGSSSKSSKLGAFIAAVAKGGQSRPGANPDEGIRLIEKALGVQLGAILQHPDVRRLEQAWRGLELVVNRAPKDGVRLDVVHAAPADAAAAITRTLGQGAGVDPPVSFAVVDGTVERDAASLAWLRALAEVAEENTLPILTNAGPRLLGKGHLDDVDGLDNQAALYEASESVTWRKEAERTAMMWVSLAMNRVLSRAPYDKRSSRVREATVEEQPNDEQAFVWLNPAWAVATLALDSFRKTGWPCRITGARDGGEIEGLPVHNVTLRSGETVAIPTEAFISIETQRTMARYGLLMLANQPNVDAAYVLRAHTAYVTPPKKTYDSDTTEPEMRLPQSPLADQLFVARLVQFLRTLTGRIGAGSAAAEVNQVVEAALWELFSGAAPGGPEIDVSTNADASSVHVHLRPRRFLGVQIEELGLDFPLG